VIGNLTTRLEMLKYDKRTLHVSQHKVEYRTNRFRSLETATVGRWLHQPPTQASTQLRPLDCERSGRNAEDLPLNATTYKRAHSQRNTGLLAATTKIGLCACRWSLVDMNRDAVILQRNGRHDRTFPSNG